MGNTLATRIRWGSPLIEFSCRDVFNTLCLGMIDQAAQSTTLLCVGVGEGSIDPSCSAGGVNSGGSVGGGVGGRCFGSGDGKGDGGGGEVGNFLTGARRYTLEAGRCLFRIFSAKGLFLLEVDHIEYH